jgi:hypothetical protein
MATGKSINLRVRPVNSVDLAYPVDGLISSQSENILGTQVSGLDVETLYSLLSQTLEGDLSRLEFDSARIIEYLRNANGTDAAPSLLSRLRNAVEASEVDRLVMTRQNAYLTSYSPAVLNEVKRVYFSEPAEPSSVRHKMLKDIEELTFELHEGLESVYKLKSWYDKIVTTAQTKNYPDGSTSELHGYEFRYPSKENDLRYLQSRAAVRQEFLNAWRMSEMCKFGNTTFPNEVGSIDSSIKKLQSAFIDTFLFPPFNGVVTGVFHAQGDYVRAGEAVLRVEANETILLVGTIKYRGMIHIGYKLDVITTLFEAVMMRFPSSGICLSAATT